MITNTENKTPNMLTGLFSECFQDNALVNPLGSGFGLWQQRAHFLNAPNVIADSGLHRRRYAQRLMHSAEVVIGVVDCDHVTVILELSKQSTTIS
jgi:hypothetical protein